MLNLFMKPACKSCTKEHELNQKIFSCKKNGTEQRSVAAVAARAAKKYYPTGGDFF
jgi:hypothetical protein